MPPALATGATALPKTALNLLCFSHLRWNFVYQRPQHLLSRAATHANVFFIEEPVFEDVSEPYMRKELQSCNVTVLTPIFPRATMAIDGTEMQKSLLNAWLADAEIVDFIAWYYTPMALAFSSHLTASRTVYDCMDQLSAFQGAPAGLVELEQKLFDRADVVFTGGRSLFEAKRGQHSNVKLFPSSIDYAHFAASRSPQQEPDDQVPIPHPRVGFFGVIDERLDGKLLQEAAALEPNIHFVLIGPVVKIREEELPRAANIHYLGQKSYAELPNYIGHWDAAMLPFAINASTRFISPTKTPEYLAAGKPVISTPVRDVVEPYGRLGLARIATTAEDFCTAVREALERQDPAWLADVDEFLRHTSWEQTFQDMWSEVHRPEAQSLTHRQEERVHV